MAIGKSSRSTSTRSTQRTSKPVSKPTPKPTQSQTKGTSTTNQFVKSKSTQTATAPAKQSISRDLSSRATQMRPQVQTAQRSSLPFKPNPTTMANAQKTGLGKLAATEVPKNAQYYNKASELTGVPASMIAGIHGNESQFGTYKSSTQGPESGYGLDPRYVKNSWANKQLAKHGLGTWERGTNSDKSKLQSAVIAAEHFKRNAGYAGIKVGPNMSQGDIAGAVTSYIAGPGAGKKAKAAGESWMFRPNDTNPHPRHPGGTSIGKGGKTIRVKPSRKEGLLRWDTLLPMTEKHLGGSKPQAAQGQPGQGQAQIGAQGQAQGQLGQLSGQAQGQLQGLPQAQGQAQAGGPALPSGLDNLQQMLNNSQGQVQGQAQAQGLPQTQGQAPAQVQGQAPAQQNAFPGVSSNQDAINHFYKQGGGNWAGAQKVAKSMGFDLNHLVKDRKGAFAGAGQAAPSPAQAGIPAQQPGAPAQAGVPAQQPGAPAQNPQQANPAQPGVPAQNPQQAAPAQGPQTAGVNGDFAAEPGRATAPFSADKATRTAQAEQLLRTNGQWPPQEGRAYVIQIDQDNPPASASSGNKREYYRGYTGQTSVFRVQNGQLVEQNDAPFRSASHPGQARSGASPDVTGDGRGDVAHIRPGVYNYTTRAHRSKGRLRYNPIDNNEFRNSARDLNGDGVIGGNERDRGFRATAIQWHSGNANSPSSIGCQTMPPEQFAQFRQAIRGANTGNTGQFTYLLVRRPNDQFGENRF